MSGALVGVAAVAGGPPARVPAPGAGRLVWWRASSTAPALVAEGDRPAACWDLGAVHRLLHGGRRDDPAAVWAAGSPPPAPAAHAAPHSDLAQPSLLDLELDPDPVGSDGRLSADWAAEPWAYGPEPGDRERARRWAALALTVQARQAAGLAGVADPRVAPEGPPLPLLTAWAESGAALLAVELEHDGLPVDRDEALRLLGPRPADPHAERARRDGEVLRHFRSAEPGAVDLRNPASVRALLAREGIVVPDTRSWRLEPHRATSPAVAALLSWRSAERIATTYGWSWLDRHVGPDGRLRGSWGAADAAAGRMTASAGLHNLPAVLRPMVAAEPGHLLVRADLGQVEPRVLAVVSGDPGLAAAAREADMYAPVAAALGCDRPTAKVAVLAAMYGQTSGAAGAALARMEAAYPQALAALREAERTGREGGQLRTWGGRLLRFAPDPHQQGAAEEGGGQGRFARNALVQGAAAELFKMWAVTVRAALPAVGGRIVLCLHDELLVHLPREQAPAGVDVLQAGLQEVARRWAGGSGVRFVADTGTGLRWSGLTG